MSVLSQAVEDYLSVRRSLGYKLAENGRLLPDFVAYLEAAGASTVSTELGRRLGNTADRCHAGVVGTAPRDGARLCPPRPGSRPRHGGPAARPVAPSVSWSRPYLYSEADIAALMAATRDLPSRQQAATYETLVGLLAVTGMRLGEAVRLDRDDVDFDEGIVTIWNSKFHKSRALPLHPVTVEALRRYARLRDRCCPHPEAPSFFLSTTGTRLGAGGIHRLFPRLVRNAGLEQPGRRRPRLHDLRHAFAVRTLLGWYRAGVNVDAHMPLLSTYLGHSHPDNTYWYLSAVPELLFLASARLERVEETRS